LLILAPNRIHSTAIIDKHVELGEGNIIGPYSVISGKINIGDNNVIRSHVIIGSDPEHRNFRSMKSSDQKGVFEIEIGNANEIWENVSIQKPTISTTKIGNYNYLFHGSHIAHDCLIRDFVTLSPNVCLAGHVRVGNEAVLGVGVSVHQKKAIGGLSLINMNTPVTINVKPFSTYGGNPARFSKLNHVGLERSKVDISYSSLISDLIENNFSGLDMASCPKVLIPYIDSFLKDKSELDKLASNG
jgi:UDP-N-acetylglucosamine acyltransferase